MRLWYVGRAVPWTALLACLSLASLGISSTRVWPETTAVLLPMALASTAAATAFLFDEVSDAVVSVTPRGAVWRRTSRAGVATVPGAAWLVLVTAAPAESGIDRRGWWLAGLAVIALAAAASVVASRRGLACPGAAVASTVVLLLTMPLVIGPLLPFDPVLPVSDFSRSLTHAWRLVAATAAAALAAGVGLPGRRLLAR